MELTNVPSLLRSRPELVDRIARLQVMGGCLGPWASDGVEGSAIEFNAASDALATAALVALPVPLGLVPIEATVNVDLSDDDRQAVRASGRLGAVLDRLMDNFLALLAGFMPEASARVRLHDPVTVAALVQPSLAEFERATVSVLGGDGACRTVLSPHGRPVDRCVGVDRDQLADLLVRTIAGAPS